MADADDYKKALQQIRRATGAEQLDWDIAYIYYDHDIAVLQSKGDHVATIPLSLMNELAAKGFLIGKKLIACESPHKVKRSD